MVLALKYVLLMAISNPRSSASIKDSIRQRADIAFDEAVGPRRREGRFPSTPYYVVIK